MPVLSAQDKATNLIRDLITMIRNSSQERRFLEYGPSETTDFEKLAEIIQTNATPEQ